MVSEYPKLAKLAGLVEIPDEFFVRDCSECGTRHAPVRGCPSEDNELNRPDDVVSHD